MVGHAMHCCRRRIGRQPNEAVPPVATEPGLAVDYPKQAFIGVIDQACGSRAVDDDALDLAHALDVVQSAFRLSHAHSPSASALARSASTPCDSTALPANRRTGGFSSSAM